MTTWQDIATAPRGRSKAVIVYCPLPGQPYVVTAVFDNGAWRDSYEGEELFPPTHWMPLPPPPTTED